MKKIICIILAYVLLSVNVGASDVMWLYNINQYVT